jgi:hypothetical protein
MLKLIIEIKFHPKKTETLQWAFHLNFSLIGPEALIQQKARS